MAEGFELQAAARERVGKGAARQLRREGKIPAVIYGGKEPPLPIAIPYKETFVRLHKGGFLTNIWTIDVGGKKVKALARDYQLEPVRDFLVHVDFLRVTADTRATVEVPVHFLNEDEAPGLKEGGVLQVVSHTIPLDCPAAEIPDAIEIDLAGVEIGATLSVADVRLPAGVNLGQGAEEMVIASVTAPSVAVEEAEEAEEAEAGEAEAAGEAEVGDGAEEAGAEGGAGEDADKG